MNYILTYDDSDELYHHGVKGMRWGVRRYQNYDGSYTKKGLARYQKSVDAYNKAKAHDSDIKEGNKKIKRLRTNNPDVQSILNSMRLSGKEARNESKSELKAAKREMKKSYKQLKNDYRADKGKELYSKGETITGLAQKRTIATGASILGDYAMSSLYRNGALSPGVAAAISVGQNAAWAAYMVKNSSDQKKLRAYYAH